MTIDANRTSYATSLRQLHDTLNAAQPVGLPPAPSPAATMTADTLTLSGGAPNATSLKTGYQHLLSDLAALAKKVQTFLSLPADSPPKTEAPKSEAPKAEAPKPEAPKAEAPKPEPPKPDPAPTYTVRSGDSLSAIASRVLGDGNRWREIFDLNRGQVSNPNVIHPGQVLKLPGGASAPAAAAAAAPAAAPAPKPPAPAATYTVRSGDSLSAIAGRTLGNGDRWREIFDLNRDQLSNPNAIQAGQVLKLPGGADTSAPAQAPVSGRNSDRGSVYIQQPNGWTCGPTSLTMAAAAFGVRSASVATVNELVGMTGTKPEYGIPDNNAIPNAARKLGLQVQYSGSSSAASIRAALQRGHGVILNGSISGNGGHFIYIAGLNADGSFKIFDPYRPGITAWNDSQLHAFAYATGRGSINEIWR